MQGASRRHRAGAELPYADRIAMEQAGKGMATASALLFGRRTYLDLHGYWSKQTDGNPFTEVLTATPKYVVSRTPAELPWRHSTRLSGVDEVAALKERLAGDLVVLGSGELVRSLDTLVDRYVLSIHPLTLGTGRRLVFPAAALELAGSVTTSTGVIIATYVRSAS